jgi:hypothetical protein
MSATGLTPRAVRLCGTIEAGIGDHDPLHMGADHARDRRGIAGRLDDDIFPRQSRGKRRKEIASHVDAAEPPELAALPSHGLGKGPVHIKSNDAHASPFDWLINKTGAGGQHDIY